MSSFGTVTLAPSGPAGYVANLNSATFTFTNATFTGPFTGTQSITLYVNGSSVTQGTYLIQTYSASNTVMTGAPNITTILSQNFNAGTQTTTFSFQCVLPIPLVGTNTYEFRMTANAAPANLTRTLTAYTYTPTVISSYEAQRYNATTAQQNDSGTYLRAMASFTYSPMNGQVPVTSTYAWRAEGGSWSPESPFSSGVWTAAFGNGGIYSHTKYEVRFTVTDPYGTVNTATATLPAVNFVQGYAYRRHFNGTTWSSWTAGGW